MISLDRLIRALSEAQADPTEESVTRCLGMARTLKDQLTQKPGSGGWLRVMRSSVGLTMADAAAHAGITVSYLSAMERDQCMIDQTIVDQLVDFYRAKGGTDGKQD